MPQKAKEMKNIKTDEISNQETPSIKFLLAEYDRINGLRSELNQGDARRFEFYLTITSAILGAFLVLSQTSIAIPQNLFNAIAFCLLTYGLITFINSTYSSSFNFQILFAIKDIQKYFTELDKDIESYLYFNYPQPQLTKYRLLRFLERGLRGGSEKLVMGLINSGLLVYLSISVPQTYFKLGLSQNSIIAVAATIFLLSIVFHVVFVREMYRYAQQRH